VRKLLIAKSAEEMNPMREAWQEAAASSRHTMFQNFAWNQLAARAFAESQSPFVVMAQSDSGVVIIPACVDVSNQRISLLGEELFDYRDHISAGDTSLLQDAWEPIVALVEEHGFGFGFHSLRAASGDTWQGFPILPFATAPCIYSVEAAQFQHPRLALNMRRRLRLGTVRRTYSGADSGLLRNIYALKSQGFGSLFSDPPRINMLLGMASSAGTHCEVFTLETSSTQVAALVTFRDGKWRRFYTTYYSEAWARHSPGLALLHDVVRKSLSEGLDCDFMTGAQPYKLRLATAETPLYRVSASTEQIRAVQASSAVLAETA
jgi:CelD/BcsL family acetyltransferase involved in cellulose biosynthesis